MKKNDNIEQDAPRTARLDRRRLLKGSLVGGGAAIAAPLMAQLSLATAGENTAKAKLSFGKANPHFNKAIKQLTSILGDEAVLTLDGDLQEFHDPFFYEGTGNYIPSAALLPESVEQLRAVLKIANEYKLPVWTSSMGKNFAYGGAAPKVSGTLVLNLQRMNRVLEINEESGYAVVEPGVSFFDLYEQLGRQTDHRLWMSVPDVGWGSIIGNTMEHGLGYTPFGDHANTQCGMEVMLANGELVRTGMGAMSNSKSWHIFKKGFGPQIDTLFMQSNFGITTKMGVWLMPRPEVYLSGSVDIKKDSDLGALIDAIRPLMMDRTIHNYPIVGNILGYASQISTRDRWYQGDDPMPEAVLQKISDETGIGRWSMRFALYGYESVVDTHYGIIKKSLEKIPGSRVSARKYPGDTPQDQIHVADKSQAGIPGLEIMHLLKWYGGNSGGHLGFSPITPLVGKDVEEQSMRARKIAEQYGHDYLCGIIIGPRSASHICEFIFETDNKKQTHNAYEACRALIKVTSKHGYGEYRAHLDVMDEVAAQYNFNNHAYMRFIETLKDALDPNGILSPGKQGIWPQSMRRDRG